jgi:hypothetical protein
MDLAKKMNFSLRGPAAGIEAASAQSKKPMLEAGQKSDVRSYFWPNSNRFFAAY